VAKYTARPEPTSASSTTGLPSPTSGLSLPGSAPRWAARRGGCPGTTRSGDGLFPGARRFPRRGAGGAGNPHQRNGAAALAADGAHMRHGDPMPNQPSPAYLAVGLTPGRIVALGLVIAKASRVEPARPVANVCEHAARGTHDAGLDPNVFRVSRQRRAARAQRPARSRGAGSPDPMRICGNGGRGTYLIAMRRQKTLRQRPLRRESLRVAKCTTSASRCCCSSSVPRLPS